jgi:sialic acid synthase SpsE
MLYGYFVQNNARFSSVHRPTSSTQCVSYWEQLKLNKDELNELLRRANKDDVAFSIASFSGTPVETIRAAIKEHEAARAPQASLKETARLGALC